jgi:hypothetical protein
MTPIHFYIEGSDGRKVLLNIRHPNKAMTLQAQRAARRTFLEAVRAGRFTEDQAEGRDWLKRCEALRELMRVGERELAQEGRSSDERRAIALRLHEQRKELTALTDDGSAETVGGNAHFETIVATCAIDNSTGRPVFNSAEEYRRRAAEPLSYQVALAVGTVLFGATEYPEQRFLREHPVATA